jgi:uncharacterized membrane-anchored protein YitT (DUF2179 family)
MKNLTKPNKGMKILRAFIVIFSSAFAGSFGQIYVMIPSGLTSGGLPGITRMITHFVDWNYSVVYYICAACVVLLVLFTLGWGDVRKIIALSIAYPIMTYVMQQFDFTLLTDDNPLLAAIIIGVLYGIATGIGYIDGYSSGGTDSIARVLKFTILKHVPISQIMLVLDGTVIVLSAFVFDRTVALLALVTVFINSKTTEIVLLGISGSHVQVSVLTKDPSGFSDFVMNDMKRGATSYTSIGEYTKTERRMVEVICTPRESLVIKNYLAEHDDEAFVTVKPISSVWGLGRGFSDIHEVDNN